MKTTIVLTIVSIVTLMTASLAWAHQQKDGFGPPDRAEAMVEKVTKRLELNEFQKEKLERFAEAMNNMRQGRKEGRGQHRQELMGLLDTSTLDRGRAMELLDEKHRVFKQHMSELVNTFADFSDSLDAGQRAELKEILAQRMERHQERRRWAH